MTNAGYSYDAFGRITAAPGADTGGTGTFSASYYVNDLARSITQDGSTQTLDLDAQQRMSVKTRTVGSNTTAETYAYTDDSDSPAFTQTGSAFTRMVDGVAGADMVYDSGSGLRIQITNLRGDTVAQSTTSGVLSSLTRVDEFGVPKAALPAGAKYAFHGSKQREALTSGGMIAMGVRLYQPQVGRFMQVDPVLGGTASPYEYPSDPVNGMDLDGRRVKCTPRRAMLVSGPKRVGNWIKGAGTGMCVNAVRIQVKACIDSAPSGTTQWSPVKCVKRWVRVTRNGSGSGVATVYGEAVTKCQAGKDYRFSLTINAYDNDLNHEWARRFTKRLSSPC
jgi:RHS repeat-associated protein